LAHRPVGAARAEGCGRPIGSPRVVGMPANVGSGCTPAGGAVARLGGAWPCLWKSAKARVRRVLAVQFCPSMRNWYSPVSSSVIVVSVAVIVVMSVVWRGSLGALLHCVRHE
jgi:hypothetical protein